MKKYKVCHITTVHTPFDVRIFHKECISLANNGFEVYLVARHSQHETVNGVHILPIANRAPHGLGRLTNSWRAIITARNLQADIYHFHDPELLIPAVLLKFISRKKVIYDAHENPYSHMLSKNWIHPIARKILALFVGITEKICAKFFDRVIVVLDSHASRFSTKTVTLHNYPILNSLEASEFEPDMPLTLVYAGGIREKRASFEMLEAVAILKNKYPGLLFYLIGPFIPDSYEHEVRQKIISLNLEKNVKVTGRIPFGEVAVYIKKAHIGVSLTKPDPYHQDALQTKIFEYMIYARPVIVSNFPLLEKVVQNSQCGVSVNPLDPNEIAEKIMDLFGNLKQLREMGLNGQKAVFEKFNWKIEEKKLIACYHQLLNQHKT